MKKDFLKLFFIDFSLCAIEIRIVNLAIASKFLIMEIRRHFYATNNNTSSHRLKSAMMKEMCKRFKKNVGQQTRKYIYSIKVVRDEA